MIHGLQSTSLQATASGMQVQEAVQAYVPVAHLSWGIWGFLQARLSDVPSFDFSEYGRQRVQQYRLSSQLSHAEYLRKAGVA